MKKLVLAVMLATTAMAGAAQAKPIHSLKCCILAGVTFGAVYIPGAKCNP